MPDVETAPVPASKPKSKRPEGQTTLQCYDFAADMGREIAKKLTESPKTVASAALLGFSQLDAATQVQLITDAKVKRLSK